MNLVILQSITHKFNFSGETANRDLEEVKNDNKTKVFYKLNLLIITKSSFYIS